MLADVQTEKFGMVWYNLVWFGMVWSDLIILHHSVLPSGPRCVGCGCWQMYKLRSDQVLVTHNELQLDQHQHQGYKLFSHKFVLVKHGPWTNYAEATAF